MLLIFTSPNGQPQYGGSAQEWERIRQVIRERAGNACENCGVQNHSIKRLPDIPSLFGGFISGKSIKIVCTVSHIDQNPTNNDSKNLRFLCQRCHTRHDAMQHVRNANKTRARKKAGNTICIFLNSFSE